MEILLHIASCFLEYCMIKIKKYVYNKERNANHGKAMPLVIQRRFACWGKSSPNPFSHDKSCGCAHPSGAFQDGGTPSTFFFFPSVVPFLFLRCQVSVPHWHAPSATAAFHPAPDDMLHTPAFFFSFSSSYSA